MEFGKQTKTVIALIYIAGIVNREVLRLVREKLNKINIDAVLETGYIEHLICKNNFSPVSGIGLTQKPDVLAGKILEGRVGIICDGSPHALIIPELFIENFHNSDDYYNQFVYTVFLRILRVLALFISVVLPGLFVAVTTYDQEMIPSVFLATLISSAQKTPMPIGAEIFLLVFMFELLRESGTRLPRTVGNAISIVGALIIGQAAVEAAIVSAPTIIIVALMAVSAFLLPNLTEFIVMYRLLFIIMGGILGLIGIGSAMVIMLVQLCSITSFGVPIFSSFKKQDLKDSVIRFPLKKLIYRPSSIAKDNVRRIDME
jgi:spore germination protein KA